MATCNTKRINRIKTYKARCEDAEVYLRFWYQSQNKKNSDSRSEIETLESSSFLSNLFFINIIICNSLQHSLKVSLLLFNIWKLKCCKVTLAISYNLYVFLISFVYRSVKIKYVKCLPITSLYFDTKFIFSRE